MTALPAAPSRRKPGPLDERSAPVPPRASAKVPETMSVAEWVWLAFAFAALVPFTRTQIDAWIWQLST